MSHDTEDNLTTWGILNEVIILIYTVVFPSSSEPPVFIPLFTLLVTQAQNVGMIFFTLSLSSLVH